MSKISKRLLFGAGVGAVLALAAPAVTPAAAAPTATPTGTPTGAATAAGSTDVAPAKVPVYDANRKLAGMADPAAAAAIVRSYWTREKLMTAVPATVPTQGKAASAGQRAAEPPAKPKSLAAPVAPKLGTSANRVAFTHAAGRVFFRDPVDGRNKSCSGATVNSGKRRLVITAGHCVHGGRGRQWMQNWVFYPGYQFGQGPAGIFPAYQPWAKGAWVNNSNFGYDYAVVITHTNAARQRVVDRVGGNGLTINPGRPFVTAIGYPSNFQNNQQQAFCQGQLARRSIFNRDQQLNCDMRFGASGGPWLRNYSDATRLGWIVSNQSYSLNADGSGPEYGPYYDGDMSSLYHAAESASP